jgi:hypothetical protein
VVLVNDRSSAWLHPGRKVLDAYSSLKMQPKAPVDCFVAALTIYDHSDTLVMPHADENQQNKAKIVAPSKRASGYSAAMFLV